MTGVKRRIPALLVTGLLLHVTPAASPQPESTQAADNLIALDVALQPDAAALSQIQAGATRVHREGRLPSAQRLEIGAAPRVTLVQRFVRSRDVPAITAALDKLGAAFSPWPVRLTAMGYAAVDAGDTAQVVLTLEGSPELDRLARSAVDAVQPFAVKGGTAAAFVRSPGEEIDPVTVRTVEEFVGRLSGGNFVPYLALGTAHPEFVKVLREASFDRLRFNGVSLAAYQLGRFGTAQKRLWGSTRRSGAGTQVHNGGS